LIVLILYLTGRI